MGKTLKNGSHCEIKSIPRQEFIIITKRRVQVGSHEAYEIPTLVAKKSHFFSNVRKYIRVSQ